MAAEMVSYSWKDQCETVRPSEIGHVKIHLWSQQQLFSIDLVLHLYVPWPLKTFIQISILCQIFRWVFLLLDLPCALPWMNGISSAQPKSQRSCQNHSYSIQFFSTSLTQGNALQSYWDLIFKLIGCELINLRINKGQNSWNNSGGDHMQHLRQDQKINKFFFIVEFDAALVLHYSSTNEAEISVSVTTI